jgi:hypothetical protein
VYNHGHRLFYCETFLLRVKVSGINASPLVVGPFETKGLSTADSVDFFVVILCSSVLLLEWKKYFWK